MQMSDGEIVDWVSLLGDGKLTKEAMIRDLLDHSREDNMSLPDKLVCRRALELAKSRPAWRTSHIGAIDS